MDREKKKKLLAIRNSEREKGNYNSYAEIFDKKNSKVEEDFPVNPNNITKDELHEHFDLNEDGKVTLDEYAEHINYHCENPDVLEEEFAEGGYIPFSEREYFENYMNDFYGNKGIYATDYDGGFSLQEIRVAVDKYIQDSKTNWGGGDSVDRELTRDRYLIPVRYPNKPTEFKKGGKTKKAKTWKEKYNKKYGNDLDASNSLSDIAEDTGVSKKGIQKIYNKGIGAYKTNPSSVRPNVKSKEQWAQARVYSAVMGGKAAKVDEKELKMAQGGIMDSRRNKDKEFDRAQEREYMRSQYDRLTQEDKEKLRMIQQMMAKEKVNYAKGGELWVTNPYEKGGALSKEFKFDKNFVIYVPSTSNVGEKISEEELESRVKEVENYVANEFGGYTETETDGGYKSQSGEIIEEDIVKVSVFANQKDWSKNEAKVVSKVKEWARKWGQEAIGFEYEGDLYYIDDEGKFKKGGLTPTKAKKILEDGIANGKPLTDKQIRYFGAISAGKADRIKEKSRMKKGGKIQKRKSDKSSKIDYGLDYLYNQLKISTKLLSESISLDEKQMNLLRIESIQKIIDKNLNNLSKLK